MITAKDVEINLCLNLELKKMLEFWLKLGLKKRLGNTT